MRRRRSNRDASNAPSDERLHTCRPGLPAAVDNQRPPWIGLPIGAVRRLEGRSTPKHMPGVPRHSALGTSRHPFLSFAPSIVYYAS